jgi:Do/DeqQ family serine protease
MLRKIWLVAAQGFVLVAAALFLFDAFGPKPAPLPQAQVVTVKEAAELLAPVRPVPLSFRDAAGKAVPAVVNIYTAKTLRREMPEGERLLRRFYGLPDESEERGTSLGSGVIVSQDGYVLTNNHVIEGADEIAVVRAGGAAARARVVGTDPDTDLAVLKIQSVKLPAITFGDSETIQVGDVVLAIGNPFGVGQTVTMGIVSATGRNRLGINTYENFIQTDAAINPGNSGGALIDSNGHLIGINTAIYSQSGASAGIGFAVPAKTAKAVMEQLIGTGRVERGWLGVEIADLTPEVAEELGLSATSGAVVARAVRGGPAERGALQRGDIVKAVGGKPTPDPVAVINATAELRPGASSEVLVLRGGKEIGLRIEVGRRPAPPKPRR